MEAKQEEEALAAQVQKRIDDAMQKQAEQVEEVRSSLAKQQEDIRASLAAQDELVQTDPQFESALEELERMGFKKEQAKVALIEAEGELKAAVKALVGANQRDR